MVAHTFDLVIRGGEVFDGTGGAGRAADVAIRSGRIAEIGKVLGSGSEEIDARGKIVTPGFVDIHPHYDGQASWSSSLTPSSLHGTTTVVMGNCGVGFAPVHPTDHGALIDLMEGIEDIPGAAMSEGLKWNWTSFPDFLDAIDARPHDLDICAQLPHCAMRLYVMGERALRHEPATAGDIAKMRSIVADAIRAGAFGVSTSRTKSHRSASGLATLTLLAAEDELLGIALGVKDAGRGVLQGISDWGEGRTDDFELFRRVVEKTGVPMSMTVNQNFDKPDWWRELIAKLEAARAAGLPMTGQVGVRAIGMVLGLESNVHSFAYHPSYRQIREYPLAQKVAVMQDPAFKRKLLEEARALSGHPSEAHRAKYHEQWDRIFFLDDSPDYEPSPDKSLAAMSARTGKSPLELMYDRMLEDEGQGLLYQPHVNYMTGNLDVCAAMLASTATVPGGGDGGAHVSMICDASNTTYLLSHWGRDRSGGKFDIGWLIKRHTADTARAVGLTDRGILAPGMKADLNVIDFGRLRLRKPRMHYDLPAGGKRLLQQAQGYEATVLSGVITHRNDQATGALPGRLVRSGSL